MKDLENVISDIQKIINIRFWSYNFLKATCRKLSAD